MRLSDLIPDPAPLWASAKLIARWLDISADLVRKWAKSGRMPVLALGDGPGRVWSTLDLHVWLDLVQDNPYLPPDQQLPARFWKKHAHRGIVPPCADAGKSNGSQTSPAGRSGGQQEMGP